MKPREAQIQDLINNLDGMLGVKGRVEVVAGKDGKPVVAVRTEDPTEAHRMAMIIRLFTSYATNTQHPPVNFAPLTLSGMVKE
jgi:hypothetical protein